MTQRSIIVTAADRRRLGTMLDQQRELGLERRRLLDDLEHEIERAEVVEPWDVPANVITMNSMVKLRDLDSGEEEMSSSGPSPAGKSACASKRCCTSPRVGAYDR